MGSTFAPVGVVVVVVDVVVEVEVVPPPPPEVVVVVDEMTKSLPELPLPHAVVSARIRIRNGALPDLINAHTWRD